MPLPLILGGAAALLGLTGAALAADGMEKQSQADKVLDEAKNRFNTSKEHFDLHQNRVQNKLEHLGKIYIEIAQDFEKFQYLCDELSKKLKSENDNYLKVKLPEHTVKTVKEFTVNFNSLAVSMAGGATGGALAGFAAYSGVMALGTASTGTAISTLSGAAATNATLSALGGGSLAAGGLGIAGGTAILAATVAAPAIAFMGWMYSDKSETSLKKAQESLKEVAEFEEKCKKSIEYLDNTGWYINDIIAGVNAIYKHFSYYYKDLAHVSDLIGTNNVEALENQEKVQTSIQNGYALAAILTDIITTPIFKIKNHTQKENKQKVKRIYQEEEFSFNKYNSLLIHSIDKTLELAKENIIDDDINELEMAQEAIIENISNFYTLTMNQIREIQMDFNEIYTKRVNEIVNNIKKELKDISKDIYYNMNSDIDIYIKQALLADTEKECGRAIKTLIGKTGLIDVSETLTEIVSLPLLMLINEQRVLLKNQMADELNITKKELRDDLINELENNNDFMEMVNMTSDNGFDLFTQDINRMLDYLQPILDINLPNELLENKLNSYTVLQVLGIDKHHEIYEAAKQEADEMIKQYEQEKSEIKDILLLKIDINKTEIILDIHMKLREVFLGDANINDEFDKDIFEWMTFSAITAETHQEFLEYAHNIVENHKESLGDMSKEEYMDFLMDARDTFKKMSEHYAEKARNKLKMEILDYLDIDELVEKYFKDDEDPNNTELVACRQLITDDFIKFVNEELQELSFDEEIIEFEEEDGMKVINQAEMEDVLLKSQQSLTQYQV